MTRARLFGIILVATFITLFSVVLIARSNGRPAQAGASHEGPDFSIGADVNGDGVDDCDTAGGSTNCYTASDSIVATVYLNDLGDLESYRGFAALIKFDGMRSKSDAEVLWPDCRSRFGGGILTGVGSFSLHPSCKEPNENRTSQYVGPLVRFEAFCAPGGALRLRHDPVPADSGDAQTLLFDKEGATHSESGYEELAVSCASTPTPYPTRTPTPHPPTPTPCPSNGCPPLNFAIGIDVDGDGTNDCGTGVPLAVGDGAPDPVAVQETDTTCTAAADATLAVSVYLMDNGGTAYVLAAAHLYYAGFTSMGEGVSYWLCHTLDAAASGPGWENSASTIAISGPCGGAQTSIGLMNRFTFTCTDGGVLALGHGMYETGLIGDDLIEHREAGPDELSVRCGDRTPAPTFTPSATPTPTQTPNPAWTPVPTPCAGDACPSPQFAIGIDVDGDGTNDCGSGVPEAVGDGAPDAVSIEVTNATCAGVLGEPLTVNVYLVDRRGIAYEAQASHVVYSGVVPKGRGHALWGGCAYEASAGHAGFENAGCVIGPAPAPPVEHVGLMSQFEFTCAGAGSLSLGSALGETLLQRPGTEYRERNGSDSLTVACDASSAAAGDSNCDGAINSVDATLVLQYAAGLMPRLPCGEAADVNHDGVVDVRDAALILQHTAGLVAGLG